MSFTAQVLDYTQSYTTSLLAPFHHQIWSLILCSLIVLYIINIIINYKIHKRFIITCDFIAMLLSQPVKHISTDIILRFLIIIWLLTAFILRLNYGGELYSRISVPIKPKHLETIDDLMYAKSIGQIDYIYNERAKSVIGYLTKWVYCLIMYCDINIIYN